MPSETKKLSEVVVVGSAGNATFQSDCPDLGVASAEACALYLQASDGATIDSLSAKRIA